MTMVLAGPKRYRERIPDVWWLLVPGLEHQHRYRIQNQNTNTGSGSQTPGNWTLNSFLNYSWISPPVIHTFQNSSLVVPTFSIPLFWRLTVCAGYVFEVVLVSPCFETLLPFSSVIFMGHCDARGPPSCESCSDHLVCPRPHTERPPNSGPSTQLTQPLLPEVHVIDLNVVRPRLCDTFLVAALCSIHRIWLSLLWSISSPVSPKFSKWTQKCQRVVNSGRRWQEGSILPLQVSGPPGWALLAIR